MKNDIRIENSWKNALAPFFKSQTFTSLSLFVKQEYATKKVFPPPKDIFKAFDLCPLPKVKVVILGQDPYHGDGQAHGLSFSVPQGAPIPPSLKNIYKEIEQEFDYKKDFTDGNLEHWASQGVLLLNAVLSVVSGSPASHKGRGWEEFTDEVIRTVSEHSNHVVFMLWGNFARSKKMLIDGSKHLILEAPHPSPFSVHSGFFGCNHFKLCNEYLHRHNKKEIVW
jgi:uracil-DNA glycosylase